MVFDEVPKCQVIKNAVGDLGSVGSSDVVAAVGSHPEALLTRQVKLRLRRARIVRHRRRNIAPTKSLGERVPSNASWVMMRLAKI